VTRRNLALAGAGSLAVGLFLPIVTMPFIGSVNLFNNGTNWIALGLLALAVVTATLGLQNREGDVLLPGIGAAGALIYKFAMLQYTIAQMRSSVANELKDNPFASIAHSAVGAVQIQWGWLVLALGAGLLIYVGYTARKDAESSSFSLPDTFSWVIAGLSAVVLLLGPALDFLPAAQPPAKARATRQMSGVPAGTTSADSKADGGALAKDKAAYIAEYLTLYDLDARYRDSMLDGRVPGVKFKIKNKGNRTLNEVHVRVVFLDEAGKPIAEDDYTPVLVTDTNFSGDNTPLRPNYIWSGKLDEFYTAKQVPSEWKSGRATATITDIEFAPNE
jgi:hypothetical protein